MKRTWRQREAANGVALHQLTSLFQGLQLGYPRTGQTGLRVPPMNRDIPEVFLAGGDPVPHGYTRRCLSVVETRSQLEEEEEEGKRKEGDGSHAVPLRRSGAFRAHNHTYDPFKRHSWGPGRELQDPLSSGPLRQMPLALGQGSCCPCAGPLDHSATGMLSKSVSMSGINCFFGCSDPAGNLSQASAADLSQSCSQLEGGSGTWAGSSLRRTFSFLLGMTGKAK
ncbi:hypothetical protein MC885_021599, partial [Smutsia gigantea]